MTKLISDLVNRSKRMKGSIIILDAPAFAHFMTIPGMGDRLDVKGVASIGTAVTMDKEIRIIVGSYGTPTVTKSKRFLECFDAIIEEHRPIPLLQDGIIPSTGSVYAQRQYQKLRRLIPKCPIIDQGDWGGTDRDAYLIDRLISRAWVQYWEDGKK